MPELPDVETFKSYLDATSLHKKIQKVDVADDRILDHISARKLGNELKGRRMQSSRRHGKYLFVRLDSSRWLVLHFGMTGDLSYYRKHEDAPRYGRVMITFSNGYRLAYISQRLLGKVALTDDPDGFITEKGLGPDALSLDVKAFREALGRRGMIKPKLMNQRRISGIGNVYSDEMLYFAGVHPRRDVGSLSTEQVNKLHRCMKHVLKTAIKKEADPGKMPRGWLLLLRGEGGTCPRCGGTIRSIKSAGRTAWYCPSHQKG